MACHHAYWLITAVAIFTFTLIRTMTYSVNRDIDRTQNSWTDRNALWIGLQIYVDCRSSVSYLHTFSSVYHCTSMTDLL